MLIQLKKISKFHGSNVLTRIIVFCYIISFASCGGGGSGGSGGGGSNNAGWVVIQSSQIIHDVDGIATATLHGEAFVADETYIGHKCAGFACIFGWYDNSYPGVDVTWTNLTTAEHGVAISRYGTATSWDHLWVADIPINFGTNELQITATDPAGNTAAETLSIDYILSPPSDLSADTGDREITLLWSAIQGVTGYRIYMATTPHVAFEVGDYIDVSEPRYVHRGLSNGTTYYYVITSMHMGKESPPSDEVTGIAGAPARPLNLVAIPSGPNIELMWDSSDSADYYTLYWSNKSGVNNDTGTPIPAVISPFLHVDLIGVPYYYVLTATNGYGESLESDEVMVTPQIAPPAPNAPDTTPPSVRSTTPQNNETCASLDGPISATFSEPIDVATANESSFLVWNRAGDTVNGTVSSSGLVINFTPSLGLAYNTPYVATITTSIMDLAGNALGRDFSWDFTTQRSFEGAWQPVTVNGAPQSRSGHTAIWTGSEMIVWGGRGNSGLLATGGRYNPTTDSWQPLATINAPEARTQHTVVWTGEEMIVWGGYGEDGPPLNSGSRYNPITDTWKAISTVGAPAGRRRHTAIWTGSEMIVWGGENQDGALDTGSRYDPVSDTWQPVSTNAAPTARAIHTAVWTSLEMIVWGGTGLSSNIGGRYDPATDTWRVMSTTAAPATSRIAHTAVWTGSEMIVWGGRWGTYHQSGAIYDPVTDSWQATSLRCAPMGRTEHVAVWTGTHMIVWGGKNEAGLNSGGVYDPPSNIWHATQFLGAPSWMSSPAGIWSGSTMIVWGSWAITDDTGTGGLFTP